MLRSKTCLPDVNVWLALAAEHHEHHSTAREWFLSLGEEGAVFCRVTQMGFLRLLTSPAVMGEDVLTPMEAWRRYKYLRSDWRFGFAGEPAGIEQTWIDLAGVTRTANWTDAYLAAFAIGHSYTLASFDRGFSRWDSLRFALLAPSWD